MKKVVWGPPKITSANRKPGTYRNLNEKMAKAVALQEEQMEAMEYLKKAMPAMVALLQYKIEHGEPFMVMRPLQYQTSELSTDKDDDGFYNTRKSERPPKFVDVVKMIYPGTQLVVKSLDVSLQEFVLIDGQNKEHSISFSDRDKLLTQTSIFEEVRQFMTKK